MDGNLAKKLFARLIKNTKKPDSGPVSLSAEDAKSLSDVAKEIIRRDTEGIRARWGPRLPELNDLSKIILTDEQWLKKGHKKVEVADAIFKAVSQAEQTNTSTPQGSASGAAAFADHFCGSLPVGSSLLG